MPVYERSFINLPTPPPTEFLATRGEEEKDKSTVCIGVIYCDNSLMQGVCALIIPHL